METKIKLLLSVLVCMPNFIMAIDGSAQQPAGSSGNQQIQKIQSSGPTDLEIQQMAVNTVAQMATNLINIGANPHNPQHVGAQVVSLLGSFVNFVTYAMRHPEVLELIDDAEFKEVMRSYLEKKVQASLNQELDSKAD